MKKENKSQGNGVTQSAINKIVPTVTKGGGGKGGCRTCGKRGAN